MSFGYQYKEITSNSWVWNNFLSKDELKEIFEEFDKLNWDNPNKDLKSFAKYEDRIKQSLNIPNLTMNKLTTAQCFKPGDGFVPHSDIHNYMLRAHDNEVDSTYDGDVEVMNIGRYGFVIYFNDNYDGGELHYLEDDVVYKPKAGDLVVHDARKVHGVFKVKSGLRYTHSGTLNDNFLIPSAIYNQLISEWEPYDSSNPKFNYRITDYPIEHPYLKQIQPNFKDLELYR